MYTFYIIVFEIEFEFKFDIVTNLLLQYKLYFIHKSSQIKIIGKCY